MAKQMVCKNCNHLKGQHAIHGCAHRYANGQWCSCTTTRLPKDNNQFEMGEPLND